MKVLILVLFSFLLLPNDLYSQDHIHIKGSIKDSVSNNNIKDVIIEISRDSLTHTHVTPNIKSDQNGNFSFSSNKETKIYLKLFCIGYKPRIMGINPGKDEPVQIYMAPVSRLLKEVEINARNTPIKLIPGGISIDPDVKSFPPSTFLSDYIKYIPGVTLSAQGSVSFLGTPLKIYIDGRSVVLSGPDLVTYLQQLSVSDLNKIEILTEPGASFDAASGAIINFNTKKFTTTGIQDVISTGLTTHDKYYLNNSLVSTSSKLRLSANMLAGHSNFYENNYYSLTSSENPSLNSRQTINYPETPQNNYSFRIGLDAQVLSHVQIGFNLFSSFVRRNYEYIYSTENYLNSLQTRSSDNFKTNRFNESAYAKINMKKGVFQIDFSNVNYKNNDLVTNILPENSNTNNFINRNASTTHNYYINAKQEITFNSKFSLNAGFKVSNNNLSNNFNTDNTSITGTSTVYKETVLAYYLESAYSSKSFGLQLGLRAENTNMDLNSISSVDFSRKLNYLNWFPSVVFQFPAFIGLDLNVYYNSRIDRPDYSQYLPYPKNFNTNSVSYDIGNNTLLTSKTNALGIRFQKKLEDNMSVIFNATAAYLNTPFLPITFQVSTGVVNVPTNTNTASKYTLQMIFSKKWSNLSLSIAPKVNRFYLDHSPVSFNGQTVDVFLNGVNSYSVYTSANFSFLKRFNNAASFSYGSRQYSPMGYRYASGNLSYTVSTSFIKKRLDFSLELDDPFNWSRNYSYQQVNNLHIYTFNKSETRMLYFRASFRIGSLKPTKTKRYQFEEDSRLNQDRS